MDASITSDSSKGLEKKGNKGIKLLSIVEKLRDGKDDLDSHINGTQSEDVSCSQITENPVVSTSSEIKDKTDVDASLHEDYSSGSNDLIIVSPDKDGDSDYDIVEEKAVNLNSFVRISSETVYENFDGEAIVENLDREENIVEDLDRDRTIGKSKGENAAENSNEGKVFENHDAVGVAAVENFDGELISKVNGDKLEDVVVTILPSADMEENALAEANIQDEEPENIEDVPSHVKCTACSLKINTMKMNSLKGKFCKHPVLGVLVCKACNKFYNSSSFHRDEYGMEEHCRWCGDGGDVIMCDFCEKVFCKKCVKRNMGKPFLKVLLETEDMKWKCFSCDSQQIESFKQECEVIISIIQKEKLKDYAFENKKTHLGGPRQVVRKERLDCISHAIEDGVATIPDDIIKIEQDLIEDTGVEHTKHHHHHHHHKKKHKKKSKKSHKGKDKKGADVCTTEKMEINDDQIEFENKCENNKKISDEELALLKKTLSLKDFDVIVERADVPENCVRHFGKESDPLSESTELNDCDKEPDEDDNDDDSCIIIDSDSDKSEFQQETDLQLTGNGVNQDASELDDSVSAKEELNDLDEENSFDSNDLKEEDSFDYDAVDRVLATSDSDIESGDSEDGNKRVLHSDSDSDVGTLVKRSIRSNSKRKNNNEKRIKNSSSSAESDSQQKTKTEDVSDVKTSSSDEQPNQRPAKQRQQKTKKKRSRQPDSDSDFASRVKKRRRRRRFISKDSSDSSKSDNNTENDGTENSEDSEDSEENRRSTRTRKRKSKPKSAKKKRKGRVLKTDSDSSIDEDSSPNKNKGRKKIRRILGDEELTEETRKARKLEEERRQRLLDKTHAVYDEERVEVGEGTTPRIVLERYKETGEPLVQVHESFVEHLKPHQIEGIQFLYDCLFESIEKYKNGDKGNGALLAHCMGLGKTLQIITLIHTAMNDPSIDLSRTLVVAPLNTVYNWENEFEKWLEVDERIDVHVLADAGTNKRRRLAVLKAWFKDGGVLIIGYDMYRNLTQFKNVKGKKQKKIITETLVDPGPELVVCDEGHILRNDLSAISKALTNIKTRRRVVLTGTPLQNNLSEYFVMVSFVKPNLLGTKKEFTNIFMNPILNGQCSNSTPADVKVMKQRCHILHETLSGCVQRKDYRVLTPLLTPKHEYTIFVRLGEVQRKMYQHYLDTFVCGNLSEIRARGSSLFADYQCLMKIWTHPWAVKLEAIKRFERRAYDNIDDFIDDEVSDYDDDDNDDDNRENIKEDKWNSDSGSSDFGRPRTRRNRIIPDSDSDSSASDNSESDDESTNNKNRAVTTKSQPQVLREKYFSRSSRQASNTRSVAYNNSSKSKKPNVILDKDIFDAESSSDESASRDTNDASPADASNDANADAVDDAEDIVEVKPAEEPVRGMGNTRSGAQFKGEEKEMETPDIDDQDWYDQFLKVGDDSNIELSGKLVLLLEVLANAEIVGDKILVFSQSLVSLDLIERVIGGGRIGGNDLNWFKGVDYFRLDGSTPAKTRQRYSEIFNDPDNTTARLFLISTRAGSLGVNLVAANRVIVFDCSWNPSHDVQSIFRVYRFGQTKPVYVYRFVTQGTMEEKIYDRQITKLAMSGRVVDEQQIERHFTDEEIRELYTLNAEEYKEGDEASTPQLPSDPILAEVLQRQHPKWITKYHEHDVLLENMENEKLSEEERKQAWDIYQAEKDSAARGIAAREEERTRFMQAVYQQQQQQQHQQAMHNLQQQQQQQHIQKEIERQMQLKLQRELQQQIGMQRHQHHHKIDQQIQQQQDAIRQMSQQLRAQYPNNHPRFAANNIQAARPLSVEDHYRNHQIVNLAALRNPRAQWTVAGPNPNRNFIIPVPGPSNAPPQPQGLVSSLHSMSIPSASRPPMIITQPVRAVRPASTATITEIVDLS